MKKIFVVAFCVIVLFIIFSKPAIRGDSSGYIKIAKGFIGRGDTDNDLGSRSILYILLLSLYMMIFGLKNYLIWIMITQFIMLFVSTILLYKIFFKLSKNIKLASIVVFAFILNFSTITYAQMILTETLTGFLFLVLVYFVSDMMLGNASYHRFFSVGIITGLLVLSRFNLMLLPIWIFIIIVLILFFREKKRSLKILILKMGSFLIPYIIILNLFCLYNYNNFGFYAPFPMDGNGISRNAVLNVLDDTVKVTDEYKGVKQIFMNAKKSVINKEKVTRKGSILSMMSGDSYQKFRRLNSGFNIYGGSEETLFIYFNIENQKNRRFVLTKKLGPFYQQVIDQKTSELFKLRIFSLFNSFRQASHRLDGFYFSKRLPGFIFLGYKIVFYLFMILFLIFAFYYIVKNFRNRHFFTDNFIFFIILLFISYFPIINFVYATLNDANRFKFPSESLIFGIVIYLIYRIFFSKRKLKEYKK